MKQTVLLTLLAITLLLSCQKRCPDDPTPVKLTTDSLKTILGSETKSGFIYETLPDASYPDYPEMFVGLWTHGGGFEKHRFLLAPDLSAIPQNAIIDSAFVTFYGTDNATSANISGGQLNNYSENSFYIERITSSWNAVTWNNQPSTTITNRVAVADLGDGNIGSGKISILSLLKDMVAAPSTSFGLLLKLQDETTGGYRRVLFASNYHSKTNLHPVLKVYFRK